MRAFIGARFGALLSFLVFVASCAAAPAFAQSVVAPAPPDISALLGQAFAALTDFRTGALLAGFVLVVNLLVNLTKLPAFGDAIPSSWRPVFAVGLGVIGAVLTAKASGATLQNALSLGIPAGIAAGGGSVALHEAWQTIKAAWATLTNSAAKGSTRIGVCLAIAGVTVGGCAFFKAAAKNVEACTQSDPTTLARIADALIDLAEQQWLAAIQAIEPNADTAKCDMQGIISAAEKPDGGFVYTLSDGGVVAPDRLTAATQLGESGQQRLVRRARTYLLLTQ